MKNIFVLLVMLLVLPTTLCAQKNGGQQESYGIFQTQQEYHQFMGGLKRIDDPQIRAMIPAINDAVLGRPIGWTNERYGLKSGNNMMDMLSNPKIRAELDMVDDQYQKMQNKYSDLRKQMAKQIRDIDFSNSKNALESLRKITGDAQREVHGVLLPHQKKRLAQLRVQHLLNRKSLAAILTTDPVASKLEVTEDQKAELLKSEQEIEKELEREIAELRKKAREKLLRKLRSSQRKQFEEMVGDQFDFGEPKKKTRQDKTKRKYRKDK